LLDGYTGVGVDDQLCIEDAFWVGSRVFLLYKKINQQALNIHQCIELHILLLVILILMDLMLLQQLKLLIMMLIRKCYGEAETIQRAHSARHLLSALTKKGLVSWQGGKD